MQNKSGRPQPKCGFVVVGSLGTISSYDYEDTIHVQTREHLGGEIVPVDELAAPRQNPIQYLLHCLATGEPVKGPLSPALCRIGQQIVDTALVGGQLRKKNSVTAHLKTGIEAHRRTKTVSTLSDRAKAA